MSVNSSGQVDVGGITVTLEELRDWSPRRIDAFFQGIALLNSALSDQWRDVGSVAVASGQGEADTANPTPQASGDGMASRCVDPNKLPESSDSGRLHSAVSLRARLLTLEQALEGKLKEAFMAGWEVGHYDGGEHDCRMFTPTAQRAYEDWQQDRQEAALAASRGREPERT